ncbi:MAG TPA: vitamin B12-dependent ribonucleotide reductase, partial [Bacteroidia bacterium]|nr:vitamin B12-dependent ribonucleotide reductase [Bacteroidia bacterium]
MKSFKTSTSDSGMIITRVFTSKGKNPFDQFTYESRTSVIRNPAGDEVFKMENIEVPSDWSQVATDILAQKYFRKTGVPQPDGTKGSETSVKQVVHRLVNCWLKWGTANGYFASEEDGKVFYDEMVYLLLSQSGAPNSPQWFNTGLFSEYGIKGKAQGHYFVDAESNTVKKSTSAYERPQPHACFILSVKDDLVNEGGIMDLLLREARIFKYGSGVGTNFSDIRSGGEDLSGGGKSSGLMSFLKIGDRAAGAIKSGGTTRRAAKMVCLDIDHPEIESFINWKVEEEKKVAALIAAGYSSDYEGEAYQSVSGQNSNNSVRIPNKFFEALHKDLKWDLIARTTHATISSVPARKLWEDITYAAWRCADPGVQFDTTINEWHTCPQGGRIRASNPCSEYMFLDDTACNLASLNLVKFYDTATRMFDVAGFIHATRLWTIVLEISVAMAQFPSKEVARLSFDYRTLGLGYANLGSLLMVMGIPYDSETGRTIAGAISAIMSGTAYETSSEMARVLGPFRKFVENKSNMLRVIRNHRYAAYAADDAYEELEIKPQHLNASLCPDYLLKAACNAWDNALNGGEKYGFRNAQVTCIAPTGTIGLLMDCDTTGVEPDFALVKFKKLSGGGYFRIVNQSVKTALYQLGYNDKQVTEIVSYIGGKGSFSGAPFINHESLLAKGFNTDDIGQLDKSAAAAFDIRYLFNAFTLGESAMQRIGFKPKQYRSFDFDILKELGFNDKQINEANRYVCGNMTIEGAPNLKATHLSVFDCTNKCGKEGKRF